MSWTNPSSFHLRNSSRSFLIVKKYCCQLRCRACSKNSVCGGAVRGSGLFVTLGVIVLDTVPFVASVNVANDLVRADSGSKLD